MKKYFTVLFLGVYFSTGAQSPSNLSYLSSTDGGSCYEICYYSNHVYAGCANTLEIYDLTGPNQTPGTLRYKKRFISNIDQVQLRNGFLYLCVNHDGLWKFDINANPELPVFVAHYVPANINESIYDIAFYGDSVLVAAKTKVNILLDSNNAFTFKGTIASYPGTSRVRGVDVKDSLLAYTLGYSSSNAIDGVYLVNLKNIQQLDFFNETTSDPLEVYFGQTTKLLHVMGGTLTNTLVHGVYYALDYNTPTNLQEMFRDTINGFLLLGSISAPMSANVINDTVYISTQGGGPIGYSGGPFSGQVYVYKATNPNSIQLLTDIYAGLYHFDTDINPLTHKMYVASEWYGILTVDITNIYNEVDLGKTRTGGWCHGSAFAKNRLAEASEGYGVRLYDMTLMQSPQLIAEDTAVGFCRAISIDDSADYVYAWYLTGKRLRVYNANTLAYQADTTVDPGTLIISDFAKSRYHNGRIAVIEDIAPGNKKIVVADVNNPLVPFISNIRRSNKVNDLLFSAGGKLFACTDDTIYLFDPSNMNVLSYVVPPLQNLQYYRSFTLLNDTLYVYYAGVGEGIAKYLYNPSLQTLTYSSATVYNINSSGRVHMSSWNGCLFISSTLDQLKAINKYAPHTAISTYDHGADHIFDNLWGVTDLYYRDGYVFLNEYMGQTTVFGPPTMVGISPQQKVNATFVYPVPVAQGEWIHIECGDCIIKDENFLQVFDAMGKKIPCEFASFDDQLKLNTSALVPGIYFYRLNNGDVSSGKFIVQ